MIEKIQMAVVWKMPRWVIRWALVRAHAQASAIVPTQECPTITVHQAAQRWDTPEGE